MTIARLLIADDMPLLRRLIAGWLGREADLEIAGEASCGRTAIEKAVQLRPDVVLLRLEIVGVNGADAAAQIRALLPQTEVLLLTAFPQLVSLGRECGAECLPPDCTPEQLLDAVRRLCPASLRLGEARSIAADRLPRDAPTGSPSPPIAHRADNVAQLSLLANLSARERAVVEKMVLTEETTAQIARTLSRETADNYTESAVKHAMERALSKMNIEPRTRTALLRRVLDAPPAAYGG